VNPPRRKINPAIHLRIKSRQQGKLEMPYPAGKTERAGLSINFADLHVGIDAEVGVTDG
jgi:hypothetical protein